MGPVTLALKQTQVAATYSGNPATGLVNGLLRGFLSEADAEAAALPAAYVSLLHAETLAGLLAGGDGACANHDARDSLADGTRGWWFYLSFTSTKVTYTE